MEALTELLLTFGLGSSFCTAIKALEGEAKRQKAQKIDADSTKINGPRYNPDRLFWLNLHLYVL